MDDGLLKYELERAECARIAGGDGLVVGRIGHRRWFFIWCARTSTENYGPNADDGVGAVVSAAGGGRCHRRVV